MTDRGSAWSGRLAFGPGWLLYSGVVRPMTHHAHRAYQLVVHAGAPFVVDAHGQPMAGPVVVVDPDAEHAYRDRRDHVVVVYVDPASAAGERLRRRPDHVDLRVDIHPVSSIIGALRPDNWSRAEETVQRVVSMMCDPSPDVPMAWWRHPVIDAALNRLPALEGEAGVDIDVLAAEVGIPAQRLAQVFTAEVGMPVRSYVAWMRLVVAMENLVVGSSLSAAARVAGFSDDATFTSVFRAMFGISPREAVGLGSWLAP